MRSTGSSRSPASTLSINPSPSFVLQRSIVWIWRFAIWVSSRGRLRRIAMVCGGGFATVGKGGASLALGKMVARCPSRGQRSPTAHEMRHVARMSVSTGTQVRAADADLVTPEARRALLGSALGYAMDGFDLLILGFMLRYIAADLHLTPAQAASFVTATLVGAVIGGLLFGMLSDRIGRVRVLTWTIVLFAVFTGLCAFCAGVLGSAAVSHHRRHWPGRRVRHRHGVGGRGVAGVEARPRVVLCRARLAARRAGRGGTDADPAAGYRLAGDVRAGHSPRRSPGSSAASCTSRRCSLRARRTVRRDRRWRCWWRMARRHGSAWGW